MQVDCLRPEEATEWCGDRIAIDRMVEDGYITRGKTKKKKWRKVIIYGTIEVFDAAIKSWLVRFDDDNERLGVYDYAELCKAKKLYNKNPE